MVAVEADRTNRLRIIHWKLDRPNDFDPSVDCAFPERVDRAMVETNPERDQWESSERMAIAERCVIERRLSAYELIEE